MILPWIPLAHLPAGRGEIEMIVLLSPIGSMHKSLDEGRLHSLV